LDFNGGIVLTAPVIRATEIVKKRTRKVSKIEKASLKRMISRPGAILNEWNVYEAKEEESKVNLIPQTDLSMGYRQ
jgi:hypothetical protein